VASLLPPLATPPGVGSPRFTSNYNEATKSVKTDVAKAEQSISWSNLLDIVYGTFFGKDQGWRRV
jgi:hypothetical protein